MEDGFIEFGFSAPPSVAPAHIAAAIIEAATAFSSEQITNRSFLRTQSEAHPQVAGYDRPVTERAGADRMSQHPDRSGVLDASISTDISGRGKDLAERLEALEPGHPSSPYYSDGSRKPPVPHPRESERPIPGDPDYGPPEASAEQAHTPPPSHAKDGHQPESQPEGANSDAKAADTELPADEDPVIGEDGSWDWKGRHLSPEQSRIADQALARCRAAEGRDADGKYGDQGLTPAMRRIEAELDDGRLVDGTEEFALKSPDRFKEKLAKLVVDEPDADPDEIVGRINDGIRYTFIFRDETYADGVMDVSTALTEAGFELYERKNAWLDKEKAYKGVNSTWSDASQGPLFEVQVHTSASWEAKQESHKAYEIIESSKSSMEEKKVAARRQDEIFARVPLPPRMGRVPNYRKEGW